MARLPAAAAMVMTSSLLLACSLGSFDYLSAEFGAQATAGTSSGAAGSGGAGGRSGAAGTSGEAQAGAAGVPAIQNPCQDQTDGTPCDDDDVCTLTSLCLAGVCQGSADHPCVVADTVAEFSMTQGLQGFGYGAWAAGSDADTSYQPETDFQPLTACPDETWKPACVEMGDPAFHWTLITAELQHAATIPMLEVPVRRWVSDVSGLAFAALDHHHADPGEGDGTKAQLLVDGMAVWENEIGPTDAVGRQAEIPVRLEVGSRIELLLYPRANQARDMTHYSMVLRGK